MVSICFRTPQNIARAPELSETPLYRHIGAVNLCILEYYLFQKTDQCELFGFCDYVKNSCFLKVTIKNSKTGPLQKNLLPCVYNCEKFITASNTNLNYNKYSKFIKKINTDLSPHCLRSFLPNLCSSARFTNTWSNQNVFKKHYLLSETQLFDLAIFFKDFKIIDV